MCTLDKIWEQLTWPASVIQRTTHRHQARLTASLLLLTLPVGILIIVARLWLRLNPESSLIIGCFSVGSVLTAYFLNRTSRYYLGTWLAIGSVSLACYLGAIANPGIPLSLAFLSVSSLTAILLLPTLQAVGVMVFNIVSAVLIAVLIPGWSSEAAANDLSFLIFISTLFAAVIWLRHLSFAQIENQSQESTIAERQRAELAAERERTALLQQFMSDVSHDFKTPLSIINTSTYMLRKSSDPDKREHYLTILEEQSRRMSELLDQLRTMSRLDNTQDFVFEPIDVNALIHNIGDNMRPAVEEKHLTMRLDLADHLPSLNLDGSEMSRAVINLIENAIQYTPENGVITIRTQAQSGQVMIEIEDTGIGISHTDLPHIFECFYRTDKARSACTGGIGLGLAIVKKIVEAHGGQIYAESVIDRGCTFRVSLPVENGHATLQAS
jgi:signal transduction histidine kinase